MDIESIMTRDPRTVGPKSNLDHAMELMDEHDIRHLPVVDESAVVGVISDRDVVEATGWLHVRQREALESTTTYVGEIMQQPAVTVDSQASVADALSLFVKRRIGCIPVVHASQLAGVITEFDILHAYSNAFRRGQFSPNDDSRIEQHMTREPAAVEPDASAEEIAALMHEKGVRHVPILEDAKLVGIVSDRDIRLLRGRGQLEHAFAKELMSPVPQTARPDEPLSSIAAILCAERISSLPVVDGEELVGIATTLDVMIPCALALQQI